LDLGRQSCFQSRNLTHFTFQSTASNMLLSIYFCRDNSSHRPSLQLPLAAMRTRAKKGTRSASKLNIVWLYFSLPPLEKSPLRSCYSWLQQAVQLKSMRIHWNSSVSKGQKCHLWSLLQILCHEIDLLKLFTDLFHKASVMKLFSSVLVGCDVH
jgi:hypothetical protein